MLLSAFALSAQAENISYPSDGTLLQSIAGASDSLAPSGSASGKSVSLSYNNITLETGGSVGGNVYGAINVLDADPVSDNQVFINGNVKEYVFGGYVFHYADDTIFSTNNTVTLNAGVMDGIDGGVAFNFDGGSVATGNDTIMNGGQVFSVYGGRTYARTSAVSSDNTVTITDGVIKAFIFGGAAVSHDGSATVENNRVIISGDTIVGSREIYAGQAVGNSSLATASALNNTLEISGASNLIGTALYGGFTHIDSVDGVGVSIGNTLSLHSITSVGSIKYFQNLNFCLPAALTTDIPMLTASRSANLGDNVRIQVNLEDTGPALHAGDMFVLLRTTALTGTIDPASASGAIGGLDYTVEIDGNDLLLKIAAPAKEPPHRSVQSVPASSPAMLLLSAVFTLLLGGMTVGRMGADQRRR